MCQLCNIVHMRQGTLWHMQGLKYTHTYTHTHTHTHIHRTVSDTGKLFAPEPDKCSHTILHSHLGLLCLGVVSESPVSRSCLKTTVFESLSQTPHLKTTVFESLSQTPRLKTTVFESLSQRQV